MPKVKNLSLKDNFLEHNKKLPKRVLVEIENLNKL